MTANINGSFSDLATGIYGYLGFNSELPPLEELISTFPQSQSFEDRTNFQNILFPVLWKYLYAKEKAVHRQENDASITQNLKSNLRNLLRSDYMRLRSFLIANGIEQIPVQDFTAFCTWIEMTEEN